jgi:hypothetical protein
MMLSPYGKVVNAPILMILRHRQSEWIEEIDCDTENLPFPHLHIFLGPEVRGPKPS